MCMCRDGVDNGRYAMPLLSRLFLPDLNFIRSSFAVLQNTEAWIPVVVAKNGIKYLTKVTAKPRAPNRRNPFASFDPSIIKKGPEKDKAWMPKTELDLKFPPHLFPKKKKD